MPSALLMAYMEVELYKLGCFTVNRFVCGKYIFLITNRHTYKIQQKLPYILMLWRKLTGKITRKVLLNNIVQTTNMCTFKAFYFNQEIKALYSIRTREVIMTIL